MADQTKPGPVHCLCGSPLWPTRRSLGPCTVCVGALCGRPDEAWARALSVWEPSVADQTRPGPVHCLCGSPLWPTRPGQGPCTVCVGALCGRPDQAWARALSVWEPSVADQTRPGPVHCLCGSPLWPTRRGLDPCTVCVGALCGRPDPVVKTQRLANSGLLLNYKKNALPQ